VPEPTRDRDIPLERHLTDIAAQAAGFTRSDGLNVVGDDGGLRAFADQRTMPGPIRERHFRQDAGEEIADLLNYAQWQAQKHYEGYVAGESGHSDEFARYMDIAALAIKAWHRLLSAR
jgi:hypothetical protein